MYLSDVNISTYVISLAVSEECKKEIKKEFSGRLEFKLKMVPYINCNRTSDFLWNTFCSIVSEAINSDDDVIVICKEDHKFTPNYRCEGFIKDVITASELGCQLIWGGARSFGIAVPLTERLFWIDWAWGSQFIVLFRSAFMKVLDSCFQQLYQIKWFYILLYQNSTSMTVLIILNVTIILKWFLYKKMELLLD